MERDDDNPSLRFAALSIILFVVIFIGVAVTVLMKFQASQ